MNALLSTLAVAVSWLGLGAMLAGCGFVTRRLLLPGALRVPADRRLGRADPWIGLAALLAYIQAWSLFSPVTGEAWLVPTLLAAGGLGWGAWRRSPVRVTRRAVSVVALTAVTVLWLANRALGRAADYDLGLYHLGLVEATSQFGVIPGIANLHVRLGAGNAHLLLVTLLERGPWTSAGLHLANGLLVSMLIVDIASRFSQRGAQQDRPSFTRRVALLLVPATIVSGILGVSAEYRLSSPNLDLASFVLVAVGFLYLAECVEAGGKPLPALTAAAALSVAACTRPLFWLPFLVAATIAVVCVSRVSVRVGRGRSLVIVLTLPAALLAGWACRQSVLSGYPFFPWTAGGLPVDWRSPADDVQEMNRWVSAWARRPGGNPDDVLASWSWLRPWLDKRATDFDTVGPLVLLACAVPALVVRSPTTGAWGKARLLPMLSILVPATGTLLAWFLLAPDPRFALAPLWLVPIALTAWALPPLSLSPIRSHGRSALGHAAATRRASSSWASRPTAAPSVRSTPTVKDRSARKK